LLTLLLLLATGESPAGTARMYLKELKDLHSFMTANIMALTFVLAQLLKD